MSNIKIVDDADLRRIATLYEAVVIAAVETMKENEDLNELDPSVTDKYPAMRSLEAVAIITATLLNFGNCTDEDAATNAINANIIGTTMLHYMETLLDVTTTNPNTNTDGVTVLEYGEDK